VIKNNPLVSICIPTYNSAKFIRQALDSIAAQTYKNVEVIVSDNASHDNTVSIIRYYIEKYGFELNINSKNIGAGENFNKLISLASGKYVAIYHADDVYESTIVEESVKLLESDETIGLVGTLGNIINEEGVLFNTMRLPKHLQRLSKAIYTFDEALSGLVKRGWFFVTPSIMVRKKIYDEIGVFNTQEFISAGDYGFWMKIAYRYKVGIIDKRLINYRVHKNQGTEREVRNNPEVADIVLVLKKYKEMTSNAKVKGWCEDCINKNIITAARRQNYYGMYTKSNETLKMLESKQAAFILQKIAIFFFNFLKISIKKRRFSA
jgi:glycosyltransferase involved in cell wall biosynthesis